MAMSMMRRHYRSRGISIITSAINVSIKTALLESLMKKASVRPLLSVDAMGNEVELRYSIDKIKYPANTVAPIKRSTPRSGRTPSRAMAHAVVRYPQKFPKRKAYGYDK